MHKITKDLVKQWIPTRKQKSYKGNFGRICCVGGNKQMGGAIILSASAALYSGAGLVTTASAPKNINALHARIPESMFLNMYDTDQLHRLLPTMDVIVVGPGLGRSVRSIQVLRSVYETVTEEQTLIIDGDALFLHVNQHLDLPKANVVLTPHLGEWERLSGLAPEEENATKNKRIQEQLQATVVLKKNRTQIYFEEEIWENTTGNPAMATGGMGDTLTGIIAAMIGQIEDPTHAVLTGVYLHSFIGDQLSQKNYVTLPSKMIEELPQVLRQFSNEN